jgi:hypothetical protein
MTGKPTLIDEKSGFLCDVGSNNETLWEQGIISLYLCHAHAVLQGYVW